MLTAITSMLILIVEVIGAAALAGGVLAVVLTWEGR